MRLDPIAPTTADVLRELRELRGLVEQLLHARRPAAAYDEARFLLAIAAAVKGCAFTAAELRAHGAADAELRDVLGSLTSRQIGKRLRALSGRAIAGLAVQRVHRDGDGVVWAVSGVTEAEIATVAPAVLAQIAATFDQWREETRTRLKLGAS